MALHQKQYLLVKVLKLKYLIKKIREGEKQVGERKGKERKAKKGGSPNYEFSFKHIRNRNKQNHVGKLNYLKVSCSKRAIEFQGEYLLTWAGNSVWEMAGLMCCSQKTGHMWFVQRTCASGFLVSLASILHCGCSNSHPSNCFLEEIDGRW